MYATLPEQLDVVPRYSMRTHADKVLNSARVGERMNSSPAGLNDEDTLNPEVYVPNLSVLEFWGLVKAELLTQETAEVLPAALHLVGHQRKYPAELAPEVTTVCVALNLPMMPAMSPYSPGVNTQLQGSLIIWAYRPRSLPFRRDPPLLFLDRVGGGPDLRCFLFLF